KRSPHLPPYGGDRHACRPPPRAQIPFRHASPKRSACGQRTRSAPRSAAALLPEPPPAGSASRRSPAPRSQPAAAVPAVPVLYVLAVLGILCPFPSVPKAELPPPAGSPPAPGACPATPRRFLPTPAD